MGDGPNDRKTRPRSPKPSLKVRLGDGGGAASANLEPPNPCHSVRDVTISLASGHPHVQAGMPVRITPGSPPTVRTAAGVIGPVAGSAARQLEACIRVGVTFSGTIVKTGRRSAIARIQGEGGD